MTPDEAQPAAPVQRLVGKLRLIAKYIEINPDNAIVDTMWLTDTETVLDAVLSIADSLESMQPDATEQEDHS